MDKRALAVSALVGTGVAVVCVPEIMAYRRLGAITRSLRDGASPDTAPIELSLPTEGGGRGTMSTRNATVDGPARELAAALRSDTRAEVRFTPGDRALYAYDASIYRQVPIGVGVPRDAADVEAALAVCRRLDTPVLGRGCGTGLAGQTVNAAVVFDFSKHMHDITDLDPTARRA